MRFFSYISDAKVDMLLPQIPGKQKEVIAAELGLNVGILSAKVRAEDRTLDTRVTRLLAVEKHIRTKEIPGGPTSSADWIEGASLSCRSVLFKGGALLWVWESANATLLLAGSATHIAGAAPMKDARAPYSQLAGIMALVASLAQDAFPLLDASEGWPGRDEISGMRRDFAWLAELVDYVKKTCPVRQEISFLARRLISGDYAARHYVLASPLYVESP
jgi:hypothetical protein